MITFKLFADHDVTKQVVEWSGLDYEDDGDDVDAQLCKSDQNRNQKNKPMYYRPDSNPPGAVAWRRTGGQGVWSTEQEVAISLLKSFVTINIIITIIIIIISIIMIITTFISTGIIDHHHRC